MSTSSVKVDVVVSDNGTAKKLTAELTKAHKAASELQKTAASVPAGGTAGSRSVAAKFAPVSASSVTEYGNQRGVAGATGASARDFANQSQGLGGLVRLYATYAANVFAVGAAFRALSNAMDTTNMVRGLDQLGATSGMALGSLSKQLAHASDGAVSLREAMAATAKASSSGMNSDDILRMGKVAKQASQALGVDMTDALSRITRGITKLEPELLDELGIFTKVGKATEDYAKSVGKSANALPDFERRMAFSNAVLTEGEKKFNAIKIDTNPYSQLAASVQNITQNVLELINMGLGPLMKLLASSPAALGTGLALIGATIIKQAIPAITDYRASLSKTADAAKEAAQRRLQDLKFAQSAEVREKVRHYDRTAQLAADSYEKIGLALEQSQKDIAAHEKKGRVAEKYSRAIDLSKEDIHDVMANKESMEYLESLSKHKDTPRVYRALADSVLLYRTEELAYNEAKRAQNIILEKNSSMWTSLGQNEARYHNEVNSARKREMTSQAALVGSTNGLRAGLSHVWQSYRDGQKDITNTIKVGDGFNSTITTTTPGLRALSSALNLVKNGFVATAAAAGTAIAAFMPWLEVIGLVVVGVGAFVSWMSETKDEAAATSKALDALKDSGKGLYNTLEFINNKPFLEQVNEASISAKATAVADMGKQMSTAVKASFAEIDKMGLVDVSTNFISKLWGGDVRSELTDRISRDLFKTFQAIDKSSAAGKEAEAAIKRILKVDNIGSSLDMEKALSKLSDREYRTAMDAISKATEKVGLSMQISAAKGNELLESFDKVREAKLKLTHEFNATDSISSYGNALTSAFFKLDEAIKDPVQNLNALKKLTTELVNVPGVSPALIGSMTKLGAAADSLAVTRGEILSLTNAINNAENVAKKASKALSHIKKPEESPNLSRQETQELDRLQKANKLLDDLQKKKSVKLSLELEMTAQIRAGSQAAQEAQLHVFKKGADLVANRLSEEWAKAGTVISTTVGGILGSTEAGIKMRADAERQMLAAQASSIKTQRELTIATEENTLSQDKLALTTDKAVFAATPSGNLRITEAKLADFQKREEAHSYRESAISGKGKTYKEVASDIVKGTPGATEEDLDTARSLESSAVAYANVMAQISSIAIKEADELVKLQFTKKGEELSNRVALLANDKIRLGVLKEVSSETNLEAELARQALEAKERILKRDQDLLSVNTEIARLESLSTSKLVSPKQKAEVTKTLKTYQDKKTNIEEVSKGVEANAAITDAIKSSNVQYKQSVKLAEDKYTLDQRVIDAKLLQAEIEQKQLDTSKTLGTYSEAYYIQEEANLAIKLAQLDYSAKSNQLDKDKQASLSAITQEESLIALNAQTRFLSEQESLAAQGKWNEYAALKLTYTAAELEKQRELKASREQANGTYDTSISKANLLNETEAKRLVTLKEFTLEQAKWNDLIKSAESFADSLATVFGDMGGAIGNVTKALVSMAKEDADYLTKKKSLEADKLDPKKSASAITELTKLEKDKNKSEIQNISKLAGASKKMFSEKTAAHKILSGVEKAASLMSAAMQAKDLAITVANAAAKIGINIPAIYSSFMATMGPFGPAAAAAAIAAFIGGIGGVGGGTAAAFVPSAEQRQETQGTAMSYDSAGNLVQSSRGVFGDTGAKSESIANSIDILKDNSVDGLKYDNKLLKAFEGLKLSIENMAKVAYGIKGVSSGSMQGTIEGTQTSGGLLGITGLFSKSTTQSIVDSGLKISGSFADLSKGIAGTVQQFETLSTTVTKSGFLGIGGSTKTYSSTAFKNLDPKQAQAIQSAFEYGSDVIYEVGELAGVADSVITSIMSQVPVSTMASLRGLNGEELAAEISSIVGAAIDQVSYALFSSFEEYANFGEGMLETVIRVIDTNTKISQLLVNFNSITPDLSKIYGITEVLAKAAGGLDKFIAQSNFFTETFLTEAEQLVPKQKAVTREMSRLGFASIDTKDEFKLLVQSLNLTTTYGVETYQALMNLAPAFSEVAAAAADALQSTIDKFKSFAKTLKEFRDSLLLGTQSTMTPMQKYQEAQRQFDTTYAKALGGDTDAQGKLTGVANAFLDASKTYNASSSKYTQDFNSVIAKIDSGIISAEATVSTAEKQLTESQTQTQILEAIRVESLKTANLLAESLVGGKTITAAIQEKVVIDNAATADAKFAQLISTYDGGSTSGIESGWSSLSNQEKSDYYAANPTMSSLTQLAQTVFGFTSLGMLQAYMDPERVALEKAIAAGTYSESSVAAGSGWSSLSVEQQANIANAADPIGALAEAVGAGANSNPYGGSPSASYDGYTTGSTSTASDSDSWGGFDGFASGGLAPKGTHVVGELGPELVDFSTPGRVYTAEQTFGMFNGGGGANQALISEIRQLRKEVVTLQKQQQEQTGHLITAAYDSQSQNAEQVTEAVVTTAATQQWAAKLQASATLV